MFHILDVSRTNDLGVSTGEHLSRQRLVSAYFDIDVPLKLEGGSLEKICVAFLLETLENSCGTN